MLTNEKKIGQYLSINTKGEGENLVFIDENLVKALGLREISRKLEAKNKEILRLEDQYPANGENVFQLTELLDLIIALDIDNDLPVEFYDFRGFLSDVD